MLSSILLPQQCQFLVQNFLDKLTSNISFLHSLNSLYPSSVSVPLAPLSPPLHLSLLSVLPSFLFILGFFPSLLPLSLQFIFHASFYLPQGFKFLSFIGHNVTCYEMSKLESDNSNNLAFTCSFSSFSEEPSVTQKFLPYPSL